MKKKTIKKQILIEEMVQEGWCTSIWHKVRYLAFEERDQLNDDAVNISHICLLCKNKRSGYIVLSVDNVSKE